MHCPQRTAQSHGTERGNCVVATLAPRRFAIRQSPHGCVEHGRGRCDPVQLGMTVESHHRQTGRGDREPDSPAVLDHVVDGPEGPGQERIPGPGHRLGEAADGKRAEGVRQSGDQAGEIAVPETLGQSPGPEPRHGHVRHGQPRKSPPWIHEAVEHMGEVEDSSLRAAQQRIAAERIPVPRWDVPVAPRLVHDSIDRQFVLERVAEGERPRAPQRRVEGNDGKRNDEPDRCEARLAARR